MIIEWARKFLLQNPKWNSMQSLMFRVPFDMLNFRLSYLKNKKTFHLAVGLVDFDQGDKKIWHDWLCCDLLAFLPFCLSRMVSRWKPFFGFLALHVQILQPNSIKYFTSFSCVIPDFFYHFTSFGIYFLLEVLFVAKIVCFPDLNVTGQV